MSIAPEVTVKVFCVASADCILMQTPSVSGSPGQNILFDTGNTSHTSASHYTIESLGPDSLGSWVSDVTIRTDTAVKDYLKNNNATHLDKIIITHLHVDHDGNLNALINDKSFTIDKVYFPATDRTTRFRNNIRDCILKGISVGFLRADTNIKRLTLKPIEQSSNVYIQHAFSSSDSSFSSVETAVKNKSYTNIFGNNSSGNATVRSSFSAPSDSTLDFGGGCTGTVMWPFQDFVDSIAPAIYKMENSETVAPIIFDTAKSIVHSIGFSSNNTGYATNNSSAVVKVKYNNVTILFTGDCGDEAWNHMLQKYYTKGELKSTIYKVAHHGSNGNQLHEAMKVINPNVMIASSGGYHTTYKLQYQTLSDYIEKPSYIKTYTTDPATLTVKDIKNATRVKASETIHCVDKNGKQLSGTVTRDRWFLVTSGSPQATIDLWRAYQLTVPLTASTEKWLDTSIGGGTNYRNFFSTAYHKNITLTTDGQTYNVTTERYDPFWYKKMYYIQKHTGTLYNNTSKGPYNSDYFIK